jgi:hypothetical protein
MMNLHDRAMYGMRIMRLGAVTAKSGVESGRVKGGSIGQGSLL